MNKQYEQRGTLREGSKMTFQSRIPTLFFFPSRHPAAMNIFIPISPSETQVSLVQHQLMDML